MVSSLFVTWQDPESRRIYPIARLLRTPSGGFEFAYIRAALEAQRHGFAGLPGFEDLARVYSSSDFPALFEGRKVSRGTRIALQGEFGASIEPANDALDAAPVTIFVPRGVGVPPERLEAFAPPLPGVRGKYWGVFVIRGVGRVSGSTEFVEQLTASEALSLVPEPDNAYNPRAQLIARADGTPLGYLPDYLANELDHVPGGAAGLAVALLAVHRINFPPAQPLYQVTCRYECEAEVGRALFRSTAYEALSPRAFGSRPGASIDDQEGER